MRKLLCVVVLLALIGKAGAEGLPSLNLGLAFQFANNADYFEDLAAVDEDAIDIDDSAPRYVDGLDGMYINAFLEARSGRHFSTTGYFAFIPGSSAELFSYIDDADSDFSLEIEKGGPASFMVGVKQKCFVEPRASGAYLGLDLGMKIDATQVDLSSGDTPLSKYGTIIDTMHARTDGYLFLMVGFKSPIIIDQLNLDLCAEFDPFEGVGSLCAGVSIGF